MARFPRIAMLLCFAAGCGASADAASMDPESGAGNTETAASNTDSPVGGGDKINGGVRDDAHHGVVVIHIQMSNGTASCSGSLIAPNLVLTARHCVSELSSDNVVCVGSSRNATTTPNAPLDAGKFQVASVTDLTQSTEWTRVAEVEVPDGTTGQSLCGHDLALLRLESPIRGVDLIEPRVDVAPTPGEGYTAVGFGITDVNRRDANQRRMRDGLVVRNVGEQRDNGAVVQTEAELSGNTGTCPGDSGGPALDTAGVTFGILSRGDSQSCNSPVYTRVDSFGPWLRDRAAAAAEALGESAPAWVAAPTPGTTGQNRTGVPEASDAGTSGSTDGTTDSSGVGTKLPGLPGAGCNARGRGNGSGDASTALVLIGLALAAPAAARRRMRG